MADKQVVQCENGHFYDAEKFKKDLKTAIKRGYDIRLLDDIYE